MFGQVFGISGHIGEAEHAQHCVSSAFSLVLGDADAVITFQSHNRVTHAHGGGELFQFERVTNGTVTGVPGLDSGMP